VVGGVVDGHHRLGFGDNVATGAPHANYTASPTLQDQSRSVMVGRPSVTDYDEESLLKGSV
jgi:hypothetical protein